MNATNIVKFMVYVGIVALKSNDFSRYGADTMFKIGDEVKTTCKHYGKYFYTFEGIVDDIQGNIVTVYGGVSAGLGKSDNKYLRDLHTKELNFVDEWFEEVCWVCEKVKLVHDDERATMIDPGFICKKCEEERTDFESFMKDMFYEDEIV